MSTSLLQRFLLEEWPSMTHGEVFYYHLNRAAELHNIQSYVIVSSYIK